MSRGRVVVAVLAATAAAFAMLVGAVSLTRIAGAYLGFPPGLEWTFTASVDVAGIAGGIMWTAFAGPVRRIGRPMNIVCTAVSGVGVGLDHATHAGSAADSDHPVWPWIAFVAGVFIPALAAWILHSLAVIADAAGGRTGGGERPGDRQAALVVTTGLGGDHHPGSPGHHQIASPALRVGGDRHPPGATPNRAPLPAVGSPRRASSTPPPAVTKPARAMVAVPAPRPGWMTAALVAAVVQARGTDGSYGRGQVARDHGISAAKARALLDYIDRHDLIKASA